MPLTSIGNITPYQRIYNVPPVLDHKRVFGCLCFVSTSKVNRSKFSPRASVSVFVGYPVTQKGYKILDVATQQISVSRDVVFYEHHFSHHILTSDSNSQYQNTFFLPLVTNLVDPHHDETPIFVDNPEQTSRYSETLEQNSTHTQEQPSNPSKPLEQTSSNADDVVTTASPVLRHLTRNRQPPSYLSSYKCNLGQLDQLQSKHWCNLVTLQ